LYNWAIRMRACLFIYSLLFRNDRIFSKYPIRKATKVGLNLQNYKVTFHEN
jgi:hypothetical protein